MKTVHFTNAWHAQSGGIATFYRALLDAAERRRQWIRLVVPAERNAVVDRSEFVRVYEVASPRSAVDPNYRLIMPWRYLIPGSALPRILQQEQPDVIEVCDKYSLNYFAALARRGWLAGVTVRPTVVGLSCERMDRNFRLYLGQSRAGDWFCRTYMKWLYFPMFDHHIAVSPPIAEELEQASHGHVVTRGTWIRANGVDATRFHPSRRDPRKRAELWRRLGVPAGTPLILYAGRLAPEKNLWLLMEAVERLLPPVADARLLIAGSGAMRGELGAYAGKRLAGKVEFLGHVEDRNELADLYANCDVFVHPNPDEPFGIAPLEAMASGIPLVAPPTGGLRSYAKPANAWLAEPNGEAFSTAILDVLQDPVSRDRKTTSARLTAERFHWPRVADAYLDLYADLHAVRTAARARWTHSPAFLSTPGNWLGRPAPVPPGE